MSSASVLEPSTADGSAYNPAPAEAELAHAGSSGAGETLPLYLQEIGRVPLLSAEDEVRLAQAIERGRAAAERLAGEEELAADKREELEAAVHAGNAAREHLTSANLRLVVSVARRYMHRGVPLNDLIQEGNLGLMRAVEKFDWSRGFKFSTYATWWIRQAVTRCIADDARTIRIPVHLVDVVNRMARVAGQLHQDLEREPTDEEISQLVRLSVDRIRELARISPQPVSLDNLVGEDQETSLGDMIPDEAGESLEDAAEYRLLQDQLQATLLTLTPRERHVIERRFGLEGEPEGTLTEIGKEIGVTRERIRQIENKALRKLRRPSRSKRLRTYA